MYAYHAVFKIPPQHFFNVVSLQQSSTTSPSVINLSPEPSTLSQPAVIIATSQPAASARADQWQPSNHSADTLHKFCFICALLCNTTSISIKLRFVIWCVLWWKIFYKNGLQTHHQRWKSKKYMAEACDVVGRYSQYVEGGTMRNYK